MSLRAAETAPHKPKPAARCAPPSRAEELVRDFILGAESGLRHVMEQVRRVAARRTTVLIRGETGSGKELIARAIHLLSGRDRQPFVVANCAAIPQELMESEMFGHVRGAFTGAISNHAGYFEAARRGTLILDEIGDLIPRSKARSCAFWRMGNFAASVAATHFEVRHGSLQPRTNRWNASWSRDASGATSTIGFTPSLSRSRRFESARKTSR